jgi:hypothetical protein
MGKQLKKRQGLCNQASHVMLLDNERKKAERFSVNSTTLWQLSTRKARIMIYPLVINRKNENRGIGASGCNSLQAAFSRHSL